MTNNKFTAIVIYRVSFGGSSHTETFETATEAKAFAEEEIKWESCLRVFVVETKPGKNSGYRGDIILDLAGDFATKEETDAANQIRYAAASE